ncbi:MAG TPA: hypothetical protein VJU16_00135 [Planctomycetota bacterium]|nr:hypothetical protein [Planctomycetota bacterium]
MRYARRKLDRLRSMAWGDLGRGGKAFALKHPIAAGVGVALVVAGIQRRGLLFKTARWFLSRSV